MFDILLYNYQCMQMVSVNIAWNTHSVLTIQSPPGFHVVLNDSDGMNETVIGCANHVISHHLILDLLLYFSYAFGIYLFSKVISTVYM